jgi:CheY-like chemotaxis protein
MARVLVVDDCEEFREVISDFLAEAGYEVTPASDAEAAMDLCDKTRFDLVLCDLVLPCEAQEVLDEESGSAMAGVNVIFRLSKAHPEMPIVAISGHLTGSSLQGISRFGAVRCLSKPFSQEDLLQAVQSLLAAQAAQPSR